MATLTLSLNVKVAWWVKPYVSCVGFMCELFDCEPNMDRVKYWVSKGITISGANVSAKK